jgi:hypothetical protein
MSDLGDTMAGMDTDWALAELGSFLKVTELYRPSDPPGVLVATSRRSNRGSQAEIVASAEVVERIFDRVIRDWRTSVPDGRNAKVNRWCQHIETAQRVKAKLQRQAEVVEKLGDNAPQLNAAHLHPWIWDGARSLWESEHYREAVAGAAIKLNAETQNKTGRKDLSETDLFKQVFSLDAPKPGAPRLRVLPNDGSKTYSSIQRGMSCFAEGCYAAIRNPVSHTAGELSEDVALEQLAAFSVLARWVDDGTLER